MDGDTDLALLPAYRSTMDNLERLKRVAANGTDYWLAREISGVFGYPNWREFAVVIDRAMKACEGANIPAEHHFVGTLKMMGHGGAQGQDYFLSRRACYLIALNGQPSKPEVAAAQAYFTVQTRRMELQDKNLGDEKRVELRERASKSFKKVSQKAQDAGVSNRMQPVFHDQRYHGLYGMSAREVKSHKGLADKDNLLDRAGAFELSAHDFQMNLAADVLEQRKIVGEQAAFNVNRSVAAQVRQTMVTAGATMPEALPLEAPIQEVKKRLGVTAREKQKALPPG